MIKWGVDNLYLPMLIELVYAANTSETSQDWREKLDE